MNNQAQQNIITPISKVIAYQSGITVVGRVTSKTGIRNWPEEDGHNHVFSFDIQDQSGEIRVVAFDELAAGAFLQIDIGKVYRISSASIRFAKKKFAALKHMFELVINQESVIDEVADDKSLPPIQYNFKKLSYVTFKNAVRNEAIDIVAVIGDTGAVEPVPGGWEKREVNLIDQTGEAILTLWNNDAHRFDGHEGDSVIIRKAKISDTYRFPYLKKTSSFSIELNPDNELVYPILGWYVTQQRKEEEQPDFGGYQE